MVFACKQGTRKKEKKGCWEQLSTKVSHLVSFGFLSGLIPRPLARYKSNWSTPFWYFEHSCNGWAWARKFTPKRQNRNKVEEEDKKVWKAHINEDNHRREGHMIGMMWGVGITMQRMHMWAKSSPREVVGGASNLLAQEELELVWGGSSLEYTSQVL